MLTSLDSISKLLPLEELSAGRSERLLLQTEVRPGGCGSAASISFLGGSGVSGGGGSAHRRRASRPQATAAAVSRPRRPAKTSVCIPSIHHSLS